MERYEVYKDSGVEWIGVIPEGWVAKRLKNMALNRVVPAESESGDYLSLENVQSWTMRIYTDDEVATESSGILYDSECVLFGKLRPYLAKVALPSSSGPCSSEFLALIPIGMDRRFLAYLLSCELFINEVDSLTYGVRMPRAGWDLIGNMRVPAPSVGEQQTIADYLDVKTAEIDGLVADCEREVELLREYRKAVISEAVTKGLDHDAPMKDSGIEWIGEIPEGWQLSRVGWLGLCLNGDRGVNYPSGEDMVDEGIPFVVTDALHGDTIEPSRCKHISLERYGLLGGVKLKVNDIAYCLRGSVGVCALNRFTNEGTVASSLMVIRPMRCDSKWLYYALSSETTTKQVQAYMNGTCAANLSAEGVSKFCIPYPIDDEQRAIADYLDDKIAEIDSLIEAKQSMADKLREYRKSLISEAVTGKFKVPGVM